MELVTGFFIGLVWWEIGLFGIAVLLSLLSLKSESGLFFTVPLLVVGTYFF